MPTIEKRSSGWRAKVRMRGVTRTATFATKAQAQTWAGEIEHTIRRGEVSQAHGRTLRDAFDRYAEEVSPTKSAGNWEATRLAYYGRFPIAGKKLDDLTSADFAKLRDSRLKEVSGSTISRDMNLLSHVMTIARKEWGWIKVNPVSDVRRPKEAPPRSRRVEDGEVAALRVAAGYSPDLAPLTATSRVVAALEFAIETAMRGGEICALRREDFHKDHVVIPTSKTGEGRAVPLSERAADIARQVGALEHDPVFGLNVRQKDALFRKMTKRAGIEGLNFHDSRHEGTTRLSRKVDALTLAKITGHRDVNLLLKVYYNPTTTELVKAIRRSAPSRSAT